MKLDSRAEEKQTFLNLRRLKSNHPRQLQKKDDYCYFIFTPCAVSCGHVDSFAVKKQQKTKKQKPPGQVIQSHNNNVFLFF